MEENEEIAGVAIDCFENMFKAGECDRMEECLHAVHCRITPNMQQILSSEFSAEEIKVAVFQIGPTEALRPDGMNAIFYKKILAYCWG